MLHLDIQEQQKIGDRKVFKLSHFSKKIDTNKKLLIFRLFLS